MHGIHISLCSGRYYVHVGICPPEGTLYIMLIPIRQAPSVVCT